MYDYAQWQASVIKKTPSTKSMRDWPFRTWYLPDRFKSRKHSNLPQYRASKSASFDSYHSSGALNYLLTRHRLNLRSLR